MDMSCDPQSMDNGRRPRQLTGLQRFAACGAVGICLFASPAYASNPDALFELVWWISIAFSVICTTIAYAATVMVKNSVMRRCIISLVFSLVVAPVYHSGAYFPLGLYLTFPVRVWDLAELLLPAAFFGIIWALLGPLSRVIAYFRR